jgi:hypothetical protein
MSGNIELKVQLLADGVVVAESTDQAMWARILRFVGGDVAPGSPSIVEPDQLPRTVHQAVHAFFLANPGVKLTCRELHKLLPHADVDAIRQALSRLMRQRAISRPSWGIYVLDGGVP